MPQNLRTIFGYVLVALLAFAIGQSQAQKAPAQDDGQADPLGDKQWVERMKRALAERKPDLKKLALQRRDAAREVFDARYRDVVAGKRTLDLVLLDASRKLLEAELALTDAKAERLAAMERHWLRTLKAEQIQEPKLKVGMIGPGDYHCFVVVRLEAEMQLLKAQKE